MSNNCFNRTLGTKWSILNLIIAISVSTWALLAKEKILYIKFNSSEYVYLRPDFITENYLVSNQMTIKLMPSACNRTVNTSHDLKSTDLNIQ